MTEDEYIAITNLTRIESAISILRGVRNAGVKIEQAREILYIKANELQREYTIVSKA